LAQRRRKRGRRRPGQSAGAKPAHQATGPKSAGQTAAAKSAADSAVTAPATKPAAERSRAGWRAEPQLTRSQRRDAEVRAGLTPIDPGDRPGAIIVGSAVAAALGLGNLIAFAAGVKIGGKHPGAGGIIIFSLLMIVCAIGMWRLWYGAVLGFMALLAIIVTIFALLLIEASNVLGLVVAVAVIAGAGYLFFKLVRVLSRIQMPRYPGR
jgi:hypothetical protein